MAQDGYGKKIFTPKVILTYIVIGAIVYGIIYYFVFAQKGGGYSTTPGTNYNYTTPAPRR